MRGEEGAMKSDRKKLVSIVLPCFNEEAVLPKTIVRVKNLTQQVVKLGFDYEIVMVDDGSHDRTKEIIKSYCRQDKNIMLVAFSRNFGQQLAALAGLRHANGDAVILMDADLQDPPEVALEMIKKWQAGADMVYGVRKKRARESLFNKIMAFLFYRIIYWLADSKIPMNTSDFRLMDKKVVHALSQMRERTVFLRGMVAWLGFSQDVVYFVRQERAAGKTKYNFAKLLVLALDAVFSFSNKPLKFANYLGFLVSLLSLGGIGWVLWQRLVLNNAISGWATIMVAMMFLGGVQLIVLGILGEYIGRIYREVKDRPPYVVDEVLGGAGHDEKK